MKLNILKIILVTLGLLTTAVFAYVWFLTTHEMMWVYVNGLMTIPWILLLFSNWVPEIEIIKISNKKALIGAALLLTALLINLYCWFITGIDPLSAAFLHFQVATPWAAVDTLIYPFLLGLILLLTNPKKFPRWFWGFYLFLSFFLFIGVMTNVYAAAFGECPPGPEGSAGPPCFVDMEFGTGTQFQHMALIFILDHFWQIALIATAVFYFIKRG